MWHPDTAPHLCRLLLEGTGIAGNAPSVRAMSRFGRREELLHGPLWYAVVTAGITVLLWRTSAVGVLDLG